jgi:hypothetical protein
VRAFRLRRRTLLTGSHRLRRELAGVLNLHSEIFRMKRDDLFRFCAAASLRE